MQCNFQCILHSIRLHPIAFYVRIVPIVILLILTILLILLKRTICNISAYRAYLSELLKESFELFYRCFLVRWHYKKLPERTRTRRRQVTRHQRKKNHKLPINQSIHPSIVTSNHHCTEIFSGLQKSFPPYRNLLSVIFIVFSCIEFSCIEFSLLFSFLLCVLLLLSP